MLKTGISSESILFAAVAGFLFGGLYYGLLSRQWLGAVGKSIDEIKSTGMVVPMLITAVCLLIMAWVLGGIIGHVSPGRISLRGGLITAAFCWLGFVATTIATNHAYQGARRALTVIDAGHWLGVLLVQGAVLGYMNAS